MKTTITITRYFDCVHSFVGILLNCKMYFMNELSTLIYLVLCSLELFYLDYRI
jgi:hypothetical protein